MVFPPKTKEDNFDYEALVESNVGISCKVEPLAAKNITAESTTTTEGFSKVERFARGGSREEEGRSWIGAAGARRAGSHPLDA